MYVLLLTTAVTLVSAGGSTQVGWRCTAHQQLLHGALRCCNGIGVRSRCAVTDRPAAASAVAPQPAQCPVRLPCAQQPDELHPLKAFVVEQRLQPAVSSSRWPLQSNG
jgi:hypothetical protein